VHEIKEEHGYAPKVTEITASEKRIYAELTRKIFA